MWISTDPALPEYLPTGAQLFFPEQAFNANRLKGAGGIFNSINSNLYHYASLNPIKMVDANGEASSRPLTKNEISILKGVFGGRLDYSKIRIEQSSDYGSSARYNTISMSKAYFSGKEDLSTLEANTPDSIKTNNQGFFDKLNGILVHEGMHILQHQESPVSTRFAAVGDAIKKIFGRDVYDLKGSTGKKFNALNQEQQSEVMKEYYMRFESTTGKGTEKHQGVSDKKIME